jgi:hypothetical protein
MINIQDVNAQRFSLNGIQYFKNFMPHVIGGRTRILNVYDTCFQLTEFEGAGDFVVNGNTYINSALLQEALLPVLYVRDSLGNSTIVPSVSNLKFTCGANVNELFSLPLQSRVIKVTLNQGRDLEIATDYLIISNQIQVLFSWELNDTIYVTVITT